jgi:FixJ family two-component response regulator
MRSRQQGGAADRPLIALVDDDESVRESLPDLLREFGFSARAFSSGEEFLQSDAVRQSRCLVLDVAMPRMSGLDVQQELARRGLAIPIIFITGHKDEDVRARAMAQGAAGFLHKPFSDSALLEALRQAVPSDRGRP